MSFRFVLPCLLLAAGLVHAEQDEVLLCGWDEVYVLNVATGAKSFSWKAADRPELPAAYKDKFRTTDECKPVAGGRILITASSDGVALVDRQSGRTTFWATCANAHSAELLPGERIAVACSVREEGGNRLAVFDAAVPGKEIYSTALSSGHGALWDGERNLLWALGHDELRAYTLVDWQSSRPSLQLKKSYPLPAAGGHELSVATGSSLTVSAESNVWLFDRNEGKFTPHPLLGGMQDVKSVSVNPATGRLAFTRAEPPNWWTSKVRFRNPDGVLARDGERLYKVRWMR